MNVYISIVNLSKLSEYISNLTRSYFNKLFMELIMYLFVNVVLSISMHIVVIIWN